MCITGPPTKDSHAPAAKQLLFIPAASNDNCLVPAIIEEHKIYFKLHIISLMFMWDPDNHTTWDIHWADKPNTHDVDQGMHNALKVPITVISDADIVTGFYPCPKSFWSCTHVNSCQ